MAIKAAVMGKITLLEGFGGATRANTAFVEPVAVSVQAILDVIGVYVGAELASQLLSPFPGRYFESQQLVIGFVTAVTEEGMAGFVE
jgi:hypothetical protein